MAILDLLTARSTTLVEAGDGLRRAYPDWQPVGRCGPVVVVDLSPTHTAGVERSRGKPPRSVWIHPGKRSLMHQRIPTIRTMLLGAADAILALGLAIAVTVAASPAASGASTIVSQVQSAATPASTSTTSTSCPTVTYKGVAYCPGTIADLNAGAYTAGTKIALQPIAVLSKSGTKLLSLGQATAIITTQPCPPGMFCGAGTITCTETWQTSTSDFARVSPRPVVGSAVNVYGTVTTTRTLAPAGWALVGTNYQDNANFHPCWYL